MRAFTGPHSQRVRVTDSEHPMVGCAGTTARRRMGDNGAWVKMDTDPPIEVRAFPLDDERGRGRHVLLYPDQCEALLTDYDDLRAKAMAVPNDHSFYAGGCKPCDAFVRAANPAVILALLDELAALRADAERYRWLRDCGIARSPEDRDAWDTIEDARATPDEIDAAIDRARGGSK